MTTQPDLAERLPRLRRAGSPRPGWVLVTLACAYCAEPSGPSGFPEFGEVIYEGDDFEVWASAGRTACGGTHAYTEAWLAAFRARVGSYATPQHHRFFWLDAEDYGLSPCIELSEYGCAYSKQSVIYSRGIPHEHEIVHLELPLSRAGTFLNEGAAEVFGSAKDPGLNYNGDVRPLLESAELPLGAYAAAGHFSRFLIETYDLDTYFAFVHEVGDRRGADALAPAALAVLGTDLDALYEDFATGGGCPVRQWRFYDFECSELPLVPWRSETLWEEAFNLDCDEPDVIGPGPRIIGAAGAEDRVWTLRALEVPEQAGYQLSVISDDPGAAMHLVPCFESCFDQEASLPNMHINVANSPSPLTGLEPGRYWLRVDRAASSTADITVRIERPGG